MFCVSQGKHRYPFSWCTVHDNRHLLRIKSHATEQLYCMYEFFISCIPSGSGPTRCTAQRKFQSLKSPNSMSAPIADLGKYKAATLLEKKLVTIKDFWLRNNCQIITTLRSSKIFCENTC